jgi:hypothetical protein
MRWGYVPAEDSPKGESRGISTRRGQTASGKVLGETYGVVRHMVMPGGSALGSVTTRMFDIIP